MNNNEYIPDFSNPDFNEFDNNQFTSSGDNKYIDEYIQLNIDGKLYPIKRSEYEKAQDEGRTNVLIRKDDTISFITPEEKKKLDDLVKNLRQSKSRNYNKNYFKNKYR